ncbi:MAG TPA: TonB-dependent receptor [Cyclobacteriaceae bacterium]|nr:TonB-dependent receptor [Cyclobacteriaceae bacterium]
MTEVLQFKTFSRLFLLLLFAWISRSALAQNVVSGKVTDAQSAPLPGVSILLKGTTQGTVSDTEGNFSLAANGDGTLVFSFIGYQTQEVLITNRSQINVIMQEDVTTLDQVVVVGYGIQEKKDITGAVAVVNEEAFKSRPNSQFGNLIQGKTAGVQVLSPSGKPSAGFSIRVRGTNSISGSSEPLYVVDGVPSADTRTINPADIESISVLKDASSAAIYGAQGANGVVLITTKKGKTGAPKFEFNTYAGYSSAWRTLKVLNAEQFRDLMTEFGQNTDWSRYTENTDWQKEVFQNGTSQNYQLSVSGANEGTKYYISGGWTQQKGAVRSAEMDRYNFKMNLEQKVNNWLTFGTNMNYMRYHDVDVTDNQAVNQGGVILGMLSTPPNIGIYNANGTFTSNPFQDWENPISSTDAADRGYKTQRVLGNVYADISILPELTFRSNVGIDYTNSMYDYFLDPFKTSYGRATEGIARNETDLMNYYIIDNTLTYKKTINDHNFSGLIGSVVQKYRWEENNIERRGFANDAVPTTNAGSTINRADNTKSEKANASFLSRITYDYKGKYLITANFRADGSSSFGPGNRWGYFPSFSVGWRLSEENFMSGASSFMDDLKLRFGWGIVGNDKISSSSYAYVGRVSYGANYPIGGSIQPGSYPGSIENQDLKWESTEQLNVGIDMAVVNSRILFTVDAYIKNTSDLLLNVQLPRSTGFEDGIQNVGKLENKGLEFQITTRNLVNELKWNTDFNISFNRNKVVDILGQELINGGVAGRGDVSYSVEGEPLGQFYGYVYGGVDPATGDAFYIDREGASTFTPSPDDRRFIGNPNADFFYGMTNTFSYRNFDLSIFLQGVQGNDIFNATRIETEGMSDAKNQTIAVKNRWRAPGDVTDIPRASWGSTNNSRLSTRFVENGSFMRVKAITLSYNLPQTLLAKARLSGARFYVTGENLFTITDYSGFDPEVNAFGTDSENFTRNTVLGVDYGTYPQTRNVIVGLSVSF